MKRLSSVAAILLLSVSVLAGNGPKILSYSNTVLVKNKTKIELGRKAGDWIWQKSDFTDGPYYHPGKSYRDNGYDYDCHLHYVINDCPNFGLPRWIPGGQDGTTICFDVAIECRDGSYTARLYNIDTMNPNFYAFYGENGQLYPEMYNKKQIKNSIPILEYISNLADDIFLEIKEYMTGN